MWIQYCPLSVYVTLDNKCNWNLSEFAFNDLCENIWDHLLSTYVVFVSGCKKCQLFGNFCVCTKWMIPSENFFTSLIRTKCFSIVFLDSPHMEIDFSSVLEIFVFQKIWRALFSWNTRFEIRSFALFLTCYHLHSFKTHSLWKQIRKDFKQHLLKVYAYYLANSRSQSRQSKSFDKSIGISPTNPPLSERFCQEF